MILDFYVVLFSALFLVTYVYMQFGDKKTYKQEEIDIMRGEWVEYLQGFI